MTVMTSGMAHISGGIMAAYILFGIEAQHSADRGHHDRARHADDGEDLRSRNRVPETIGTVKLEIERTDVNVIDAAGVAPARAALALNVGAMLISFLALVALVNALLGSSAQPAADFRLGVRAGGVEHGRAVA
jgi:CNT family concentrative nucleoside transporter